MAFKHGVYGEHSAYAGKSLTRAVGTVPAYIGTAPIHQLNLTDYSEYINKPILINSYTDAKAKLGVSDDFGKYTLMEAVYAHFMNGDAPIAPIIVVNMADPKEILEDTVTETITLTGASGDKVGYINDDSVVISTISNVDLTVGTDYKAEYVDGKVKVLVTKQAFNDGTLEVTYNRVKTSKDNVVTTNAFSTALDALDICELVTREAPNIVAAPYYSKIKEYHDLLITKAINKIGLKLNFIPVVDIKADSTTNTVAKAVTKKAEDGYNSKLEKVCYPMLSYNGKIYHYSTMAVVRMQQTDTEADGVPYVSPSNKKIYADAAVLEDGKQIYINETTANTANANGLTTTNVVNGEMRMWGGCNGNYNYVNENNIAPEDRQDASIRMMLYLLNKMQRDYINNVDMPMSRRDVDAIKASVQQWLNSLVNEGKLLYAEVNFIEDNNSVADMISGDFIFDVATTTTPNAKSITFKLQYTTDGIATLTGGVEQ